jgi:hypothetical protein
MYKNIVKYNKLCFIGTFWGITGYMRGLNQYEYKNGNTYILIK